MWFLWVAFGAGVIALLLPPDNLLLRSALLAVQVGALLYALFHDD